LLSSMPKPDGFFDPKSPGGTPTPPETPQPPAANGAPAAPATPEPAPASGAAAASRPAPPAGGGGSGLNFANSDLAFSGTHLFMGNFHGFNTYGVEDPKKPKLLASIVCPGGQGDVSVRGNLLF